MPPKIANIANRVKAMLNPICVPVVALEVDFSLEAGLDDLVEAEHRSIQSATDENLFNSFFSNRLLVIS